MGVLYDVYRYNVPEGTNWKEHINDLIENIREGRDVEENKDKLFRLTYPSALTELKKYRNYAEMEELLAYMSIAFMKSLDKYDYNNEKCSFMNYYKRVIFTEVTCAFIKHRSASEEYREEMMKYDKTMVWLDEFIPEFDGEARLVDTLFDENIDIESETIRNDLAETVYRVLDKVFLRNGKYKDTGDKIFKAYIDSCVNETYLDRKALAKEYGVTVSYIGNMVTRGRDRLKTLLKEEGYDICL